MTNFCLPHSVTQELYLIWLWLLVHMCKMMISPAIFFILIFSKLWFFGFLGGWGGVKKKKKKKKKKSKKIQHGKY